MHVHGSNNPAGIDIRSKNDTVNFFPYMLIKDTIAVCVFATINIVYNHKNWPLDLKKSFSFPWVEKGNNYLIKEFPNEKQYKDAFVIHYTKSHRA